ncbi:uncharacterized protein [Phyllobates terribilis]|uniref:uncharacterized protein isoform X2 n=1 Tax=Phyllobates terribilis TaxID=111132 RepID=UPI003CCA8AB4
MAAGEEKKPVLEMVQGNGTDESCVTFVLHEEDHTLGNALRYMIMKNMLILIRIIHPFPKPRSRFLWIQHHTSVRNQNQFSHPGTKWTASGGAV